MRITHLSLRNFRVFPELDLEVPPGVLGVYGPNGAGKSTLVESILWALFGVARTGKESLRADGATAETVATVEFEHDGHLYEVTRSVSGPANSVKAEAACDGQRVAAGAVAVRQYVHQVLGMSAEAFRSSVFCEQKQLDAFSGRRPEDRRKLERDRLAAAYAAGRRRHEEALARLAARRSELAALEAEAVRLPALTAAAADLAGLRLELDAVEKRDSAWGRLVAADRELAEAMGAGGDGVGGADGLESLPVLEEAAAAAGRRAGESAGRRVAAEAAVTAARAGLEAATAEARA